jgi:hypothetical protein
VKFGLSNRGENTVWGCLEEYLDSREMRWQQTLQNYRKGLLILRNLNKHLRMIWGSHGGEYEDGCLLGCSAVWTGIKLPVFQRFLLPPSSGRWYLIALMMEAVRTSETSVNSCQSARCCSPEDSRIQTSKDSVRTAKKTPHFTVTKINRLTLFKEIIAVCSENHRNHVTHSMGKMQRCWLLKKVVSTRTSVFYGVNQYTTTFCEYDEWMEQKHVIPTEFC